MDKSMGFALLLIIVILVPSVLSQSEPEYDHSKRTIDFRYPDYIVDPRPPCLSEGFFQHPRNCSWFYRCHDIRNLGIYFRQFYFECAPGTVFAASLSVCVGGDHKAASCGNGTSLGTDDGSDPDTGDGDSSGTDLGDGSPPDIGEGGSTDTGAGGETSTDTGDGPSPGTEIGTPDENGCYDFMIICKEYICPTDDGLTTSIGAVCQQAYKKCADGVKTDFCENSLFYNIATKKCINSPVEDGCTEVPNPLSSTTTTTTTTSAPEIEGSCHETLKGCAHYFCPIENKQYKDEYLCSSASRTCNANTETVFCLENDYYNFDTQECVSSPETRKCIPEEEPSNESLNISFYVECSGQVSRPRNAKFEELFCQNYDTCEKLRQTQTETTLCQKYLQCVFSKDDWTVTFMECPKGLLYNYAEDKCKPIPEKC